MPSRDTVKSREFWRCVDFVVLLCFDLSVSYCIRYGHCFTVVFPTSALVAAVIVGFLMLKDPFALGDNIVLSPMQLTAPSALAPSEDAGASGL